MPARKTRIEQALPRWMWPVGSTASTLTNSAWHLRAGSPILFVADDPPSIGADHAEKAAKKTLEAWDAVRPEGLATAADIYLAAHSVFPNSVGAAALLVLTEELNR